MPEKATSQPRVKKPRGSNQRSVASDQSARGSVADRRELLEFLTKVMRTPIGEVTAGSDLCERAKTTAVATEFAMPDKRACVEMLARLQGFFTDRSRSEPGGKVDEGFVLTEERRRVLMEKKRAAGERGRMKDEG